MNIGTKSLLFGCHQFVIHPYLVYKAWRLLYGKRPTLGELLAIITHDWGYLGKPNMDGPEGESHPLFAGDVFSWLGRSDLARECWFHSRFLARRHGQKPSRLCYADKLGNALMPVWLYARVGTWTGEIDEYVSATKHEGVRGEVDAARFFLRYRGVVRQVLLKSEYDEVREYAQRWDLDHVEYNGPLNA